MKNPLLIISCVVLFLASCESEYIEVKDFEWVHELKSTYDEQHYILDVSEDKILLSEKGCCIELGFEGDIIKKDTTSCRTSKSQRRIFFYAQTMGVPMLSDGRKSVVHLMDSSIFKEVYFVDKIIVKARIDRNYDEFQKYLQFYSIEQEKKYKLRFNDIGKIKDVYDIVQIDKHRLAITFEKYIKASDNIYCIGVLNLSDLID